MKISHGRYYYQFHDVVEKLRREDNSCFICGSTRKVKPHHIIRVRENDRRYASPSNIVLLCSHHHGKFHQVYGSGKGVNRHNFDIFVKKEHLREINQLKKEVSMLKNERLMVDSIVKSAVKNERTCHGSNVLRNLAENIGVELE